MKMRKFVRKKTRPEAFEHSCTPEQLSALRAVVEKEGFQAAADRSRELCGLQVSITALHRWYHKGDEELVLGCIASGAALNRKLDAAYQENPAPEIERLMELNKTLIMQLSVHGAANPALLEIAVTLQRSVLDWVKVEQKRAELKLSREKFEFDAAKACLAKLPDLKAVSDQPKLSPDEKAAAIRQILFPH